MFRGFEERAGYADLRASVGVLRVLSAARRLLMLFTWFAIIAMCAGIFAYWQLSDSSSALRTLLLALVLLGPPLVLLHFVLILRLLGLRFAVFTPRSWLRLVLASRVLAAGTLLQPWYWGLLFVSVLASLAIVPFALLVAIL
jgi:hypothetical protein